MTDELLAKIERLEAEVAALKDERLPKVDRASKRRDRRQVLGGFGMFILALTVAGTLSASALAGTNTVASDDIIDGQIYTTDIRDSTISGTDVRNSSLTGADIGDNSLTGVDLGSNAIGSRELAWESFQTAADSAEIVAGGTSQANTATEVRAQCPAGAFAVGGGAYWDFPSGTLSGVRILAGNVLAEGRNGGSASQRLHAFAFCMP